MTIEKDSGSRFSGVLFWYFSGLEGEIHEKTKFFKLYSSCVEKRTCGNAFQILSVIWQGIYPAGMVLAGGYLIDVGVLVAGDERKVADIVPVILLCVGFMLANQTGKMFRGFVELKFERDVKPAK